MKTTTEEFVQRAILNPLRDQKCAQLHPEISCNAKMLQQFSSTCKALYKMYLIVHLIPFLIFKRKKLKKRPIHELTQLVKAFLKSMLFAGGYTVIVRRTICFLTEHYKFECTNGMIGAFLAGITLNFEPQGRQSEIALYCLNKSMETLYHIALRRNLPVRIPYGECLLVGGAIGIICFTFVDRPDAIKDNYTQILDKLIGNI